MVILTAALMVIDFKVLFYFSFAGMFFMTLKADRIRMVGSKMSKCDCFIVLWTLIIIVANMVMLIAKAIYSPLPFLSEAYLGQD